MLVDRQAGHKSRTGGRGDPAGRRGAQWWPPRADAAPPGDRGQAGPPRRPVARIGTRLSGARVDHERARPPWAGKVVGQEGEENSPHTTLLAAHIAAPAPVRPITSSGAGRPTGGSGGGPGAGLVGGAVLFPPLPAAGVVGVPQGARPWGLEPPPTGPWKKSLFLFFRQPCSRSDDQDRNYRWGHGVSRHGQQGAAATVWGVDHRTRPANRPGGDDLFRRGGPRDRAKTDTAAGPW